MMLNLFPFIREIADELTVVKDVFSNAVAHITDEWLCEFDPSPQQCTYKLSYLIVTPQILPYSVVTH